MELQDQNTHSQLRYLQKILTPFIKTPAPFTEYTCTHTATLTLQCSVFSSCCDRLSCTVYFRHNMAFRIPNCHGNKLNRSWLSEQNNKSNTKMRKILNKTRKLSCDLMRLASFITNSMKHTNLYTTDRPAAVLG